MSVPEADHIRRSALKSVVWVSVDKWGTRLTSLVTFAVLGRLLAPADFGLVALAAVFIAILSIFVDAGFSQVLVQRATISRVQVSTAFWTSVGVSLCMYGVLAAVARPLALLYDQPRLEIVLYLVGLQLPITAVASVPEALLIRRFAFSTLAVRQLCGVFAGAAAGLAAAAAGLGVWALIIQTLVGAVISCAVLWVRGSWRPSAEFSLFELKGMLGFGMSILGTEAVNLINSQGDKLVVGSILGPTALGYYYVGSRLVSVVADLMTVVIARVSLTTFSRLQDQPARMMRAYYAATFGSAAIALPVFGALAVLAPFLVPLLFGDNWGPSVLVMQVLVPSAAISSIMYFDKSALLARGFGRDTFLLALCNTIIGFVLVVLATPWGAVGVGVSRSLRQVAFWPVRQVVLRRRLDLDVRKYLVQFGKPLLGATVSTATIGLLARILPGGPVIIVLTSGLIGAAAYMLVMLLVAREQLRALLGNVAGPRATQPPVAVS